MKHTGSLLALLLASTLVAAADGPQWMGPNRDDVWDESGILEKFPEGGPKVLWRNFAAIDTDADGAITPEELWAMHRREVAAREKRRAERAAR